jgi:hypothetical protein
VTISNGIGTSVNVSTAQGIVTTIQNTLNNMSFQTKVDLNYVVNNYGNVLSDSQAFHQAASLAQQMLILPTLPGGH